MPENTVTGRRRRSSCSFRRIADLLLERRAGRGRRVSESAPVPRPVCDRAPPLPRGFAHPPSSAGTIQAVVRLTNTTRYGCWLLWRCSEHCECCQPRAGGANPLLSSGTSCRPPLLLYLADSHPSPRLSTVGAVAALPTANSQDPAPRSLMQPSPGSAPSWLLTPRRQARRCPAEGGG